MSYPEKQLNGYVLLVDAQGSAQDDVAAPDAGNTLLYTTEQGLVVERAPVAPFDTNQWFLDKPVLLEVTAPVSLTGTAQSLLDAPYTIPDDIDANFPTLYRLEGQVVVSNFSPDANGSAIAVVPYVDGSQAGPLVLVPCDAFTGDGGTTVTFFVSGSSGQDVDIRAYLLNAADSADATLYLTYIRRELRVAFP